MTILHSIILGIVEGITEFLPISSTAHIDFARFFLQIPVTEFIKSFEIIIQLGAILAVVVLYFHKIFKIKYIKNIIIAFIPTGIIGFLLYKIIKTFLVANTLLAAIMLVLGGILILYFEKRSEKRVGELKDDVEKMSLRELIILGIAQALAVVPGVSRSGAVIVTGRELRLSPKLITEFSFLLAVPTMLSATVYDVYKSGIRFTGSEWNLVLVGFVVSFFVALLVIKWLINYIKNHSFKVFGWYRIIFGIIILFGILMLDF